MVQILPAEQTFGSTLGQALGQGFGGGLQAGLSSSLDQYFSQKKAAADSERKQSMVNKYLSSAEGQNLSPLAQTMIKAHAQGLVPEAAVKEALAPEIFKQKLEALRGLTGGKGLSGQEGEEMDLAELSLLSPEYAKAKMEQQKSNLAREQFEEKKRQTALREKEKQEVVPQETKKRLDAVFKRQLDIMKKGGTGLPYLGAIAKLDPKQRRMRAEFDTLGASIEAALLPLVNKGTLAKERFNYILSNIPKSDDTTETALGKIAALKTEFGIELPELEQLEKQIETQGKKKESQAAPQVGQTLDNIKGLPVGTILKKNNKRYQITEQGLREIQ